MRSLILILAVAALASAGPALAGGGMCLPSCDVASHNIGFFPPVTAVESGSTVTWSSLDIGHTATDFYGSGPPTLATCFNTDFTKPRPGSAFFTILEGKLFAISETNGGELTECDNALALPDGSFEVDYICAFHNRMEGKLVIR